MGGKYPGATASLRKTPRRADETTSRQGYYVRVTATDRPPCLCGCGGVPNVKSNYYVRGHDQKHISDLVTQVIEGAPPDLIEVEFISEGMRSKFDSELERRRKGNVG